MEEKIKKLLCKELESMKVYVDSVAFVKSNNQDILDIIIDSSDITVDLEVIVKASKIINDVLDERKLVDDKYVIDCHSKVGGMN